MSATLFTNVSVFDGSGAPSFAGQVLVTDSRISAVARAGDTLPPHGDALRH